MFRRFLIRRFLIGAVQMLGLTLAVFFLVRLLPADPVARLVGMNASPQAYAQAQRSLGLDKPVLAQLADYLGVGDKAGLLQADLGVSWVSNSPVLTEIGASLPITLELLTLSFLVTLLIAVPVGVASARQSRQAGRQDRLRLWALRRLAAGILVGPALRLIFFFDAGGGAGAARD